VTFTVEITAFEPPRRMAATWSDPMAGGWEARFDPAEGGTELSFTTRMEPGGPMGLLAPLMRPWAARQLRRFMVDFKRWAEAQPGPISPPADDSSRVASAAVR
jgi:hypothetical protein